MSTQRKLWLGFGTLLAILVLSVLGVAMWLRALLGNLQDITAKAEPASTAAYEMRIGTLGTGVGVLYYLHTGAAGYRERVVEAAADFRRNQTVYAELAVDKEAAATATQVAAVYEEYYGMGERLMRASDANRELLDALGLELGALLDRLEVRAQRNPSEGRSKATAASKARAASGMHASLSGVGTWLESYSRTTSAEDRQRLLNEQQDFYAWLAQFRALPLTREEVGWVDATESAAAVLLRRVNEAVASFDERQQDLQEFSYLGSRLDILLDQGIHTLAQRDLNAAARSARRAIQSILLSAVLLLIAGVIVSIATGVLVSRGIVRTEQTLRVTLTSIGDAVIATDADGRITFMNRMAEALTRWNQIEARHRPLAEVLRLVDEETRAPMVDPTAAVLRMGSAVALPQQALLVARGGAELPIDDSAAPILDDQDKVVGVVLVFRDSSQRRRSEQELREADRRKDEFLAMLAHELRNPLAPLRNGLLILRSPGVDEGKANEVLEMMVRQVQNMTRMIDDLLDVSRITRGKIELRKERVDLGALLERVTALMRPEFDGRERTLTVSLPSGPLFVDADSTRLEQVVGNLLSNALKYTRAGGHTWLLAGDEDGAAVIRVRDDGAGIAAEMLPQIFDLFAQADRTIARSQGGLGIGLTLVRNLVEMHGGTVHANSAGAGRGSEFVVRLPLAPAAVEPRPDQICTAVLPAVAATPLRVLVVDDNVDSADSLALLLSLRGHEVHTAHDGPGAIERAQTLQPDLVLLDIGLPGIDGYEVARQLRGNGSGRRVRLVAMTGYGRPEDRERAREAGFHHHLVKPVDMEALQSILQDLASPTV
jgi:PAS domain S-box-containing protein